MNLSRSFDGGVLRPQYGRDHWGETNPGASSTAGKCHIPVLAETPRTDLLEEFAFEPARGLAELIEEAAQGGGAAVLAVDAIAKLDDPRVTESLLVLHRGSRDAAGRIRETADVREAAARALAAKPECFARMLVQMKLGTPLEQLEALHIVAHRRTPESNNALSVMARGHSLFPSGPESVDLARVSIQYLGQGEEPEVLPVLIEIAQRGGGWARVAAVTALGLRDEPEAMAVIRDRARNDTDRLVRMVATRAIR